MQQMFVRQNQTDLNASGFFHVDDLYIWTARQSEELNI